MIITREITDGQATTTGKYMHQMVNRYYKDMVPYASMPLIKVYDIIKAIPYRPDPPNEETLMRPLYTLTGFGTGGDCDDKAIALASYAKLVGIPYRFIAARKKSQKTLHHVYPELYIRGVWTNADATYAFNSFGREREGYAQKVII